MTKLVALGAAAALALGCGSAGVGTATGLRAYGSAGPGRPAAKVAWPCEEPARGVKLRSSRAGKLVATATTNNLGWYRVVLRAGSYGVSTNAQGSTIGPRSATVRRGRMTRRDFVIDTGIR